jgi:hypothetical protein
LRALFFGTGTAPLLPTAVASAAEPGATGAAPSLPFALAVLVAVGAAFLLVHAILARLRRRFLVSPGIEYVALGALLGPAGARIGIPSMADPTALVPIIVVVVGWVGFARGVELDPRQLVDGPRGTLRVVVGHHLATGLAVGAAAYAALGFGWVEGVTPRDAAVAAWVLGCCAAADSAAPVALIGQRLGVEGGLSELLRRSAFLGDLFIIFAFGLLFCLFHPDQGAALPLSATEWAVLSVGLGLFMGLVFGPFITRTSANEGFLALIGIVTFASGVAWFLRLDPLLINMSLGIVLASAARRRPGPQALRPRDAISTLSGPALLLFAGALWQPPPTVEGWRVVGLAVTAFIALRLLGKMVGSWLVALGSPLRPDLFRGLLGHGEVTVAMAISFRLVYDGPAADLAYTVVLISVVLHDLAAPRALRSLFIDAGMIRRDQRPAPASP